MRDESGHLGQSRRSSLPLLSVALFAALLAAGLGLGVDARAETKAAKPRSARKIFDLTPPHPGELLANPARGSGSPPQLKEFAPSAAMHLSQEVAGDATSSESGSQQASANAGKADPGPRALAAGPPVQASQLQMQLTDEITRLGIDGFLSQPPQAGSPQEQQYWETLRREIASSLATWQTLYAPSSAPKSSGPQAPPTPPSPVPEAKP